VWIDNLAAVTIENDCCVSQECYLCTGNHNWNSERFDLLTGPITVKRFSWLAARVIVAPNVTIDEGSIVALGGVVFASTDPWYIYTGNPASKTKPRVMRAVSN
jgi:putative colanic acid biosynthesis acetyltransferase WcaF